MLKNAHIIRKRNIYAYRVNTDHIDAYMLAFIISE